MYIIISFKNIKDFILIMNIQERSSEIVGIALLILGFILFVFSANVYFKYLIILITGMILGGLLFKTQLRVGMIVVSVAFFFGFLVGGLGLKFYFVILWFLLGLLGLYYVYYKGVLV